MWSKSGAISELKSKPLRQVWVNERGRDYDPICTFIQYQVKYESFSWDRDNKAEFLIFASSTNSTGKLKSAIKLKPIRQGIQTNIGSLKRKDCTSTLIISQTLPTAITRNSCCLRKPVKQGRRRKKGTQKLSPRVVKE